MEYVTCNLCGKNDTRELFVKFGQHVVRCNNCSLVYVNPRMTPEELVKIYNEHYYDNPSYYSDEDLKHYGYDSYFSDRENIQLNFSKRLARLNAIVDMRRSNSNGKSTVGKSGSGQEQKRGKLLDIGCAAGFFLDLARKSGWSVSGLDLSKEAVEYGVKELGLDLQQKMLKEAKFKANTFDAVTIFDVIEHLPDPKSELIEMHRILKKGGVVVITTPNVGAFTAQIFGKHWAEYKRVREHIYFFSNKTLWRMLEDVGFEVVRTETTGRVFTLEGLAKLAIVQHKWLGLPYRLLKGTWLGRTIKINFNPLFKTTVYAVKR